MLDEDVDSPIFKLSGSDEHASLVDEAIDVFPYFQAIVDVSSGTVAGYESLARMRNHLSEVVPSAWLFEDRNLRLDERMAFDRSVRSQAIHRFAQEPDAGLLFLNISPRWVALLRAGIESPTLKMLRRHKLDPSRVVIEVTELGGHIDMLSKAVRTYKDIGMKVAIDDFGVGASQLDRLIALDPDYLKLDMSLFKDASRAGSSAKVVMALSALAEQSRCEIICEGIESEQEYHFALECGAQKVQGWLFHEASEQLLDAHASQAKVNHLQAGYLQRKKDRLSQSIEASRKLEATIKKLVDAYKANRLTDVDSRAMHKAGLLGFFVCDQQGRQISPNYSFGKKVLDCNSESTGWHWAHRPYFPVVLALNEMSKRRQIVSRNYIDNSSKVKCKTYGLMLDDGSIMLIDAMAFETTLYCESLAL